MSTYVKLGLGFIALGALLLAATSSKQALAMPVRKAHTPFVVHGCPWECCALGESSVARSTALHDRPEGRKVVGRVSQGELVTIEAADELVHPLRLTVVFPHGTFKQGDVVFTGGHIAECGLDYEGRAENDDCLSELEVNELVKCKDPASAKCWAQVSGNPPDAFTVWVRVRTQKGKVGWAKEEAVPGKDLCGWGVRNLLLELILTPPNNFAACRHSLKSSGGDASTPGRFSCDFCLLCFDTY